MKNYRLTFNSSTNLTLPIKSYLTIEGDALYHGYTKNERPNIGGFLNDLIPALSDYQDDLYDRLLKYNNGSVETVKTVIRNIHNVYLNPSVFHMDGMVNQPFRISNDKYEVFQLIHDRRLLLYDTNFTQFLRTILVEYASKPLCEREYMFAFPKIALLKKAISKNQICTVYHTEGQDVFVPVSIESSPIFDYNYIVGITREMQPVAIRLLHLQNIVVDESRVKRDGLIKVTDEMCDIIHEHLKSNYDEEYRKCLG